jgi:hypothetical protein
MLRMTVNQPVCQGVEPTLGLVTRYYFLYECCCLKVAVFSLWGVLSDERSGLSFVILSLQQFISIYLKDLSFLCFTVQQSIYNIYKASFSPGSVQQIMLY